MQRSQSIADILLWIFFTPFPDFSTLPFQWVTYLTKQSPHNQHNPSKEETASWKCPLSAPRGHSTILPTLQHFTGIPKRFSILPVATATFCMNAKWGISCNHVAVSIQADWNELINMVAPQIFITLWQVFSVSVLRANAIIPVKGTEN